MGFAIAANAGNLKLHDGSVKSNAPYITVTQLSLIVSHSLLRRRVGDDCIRWTLGVVAAAAAAAADDDVMSDAAISLVCYKTRSHLCTHITYTYQVLLMMLTRQK